MATDTGMTMSLPVFFFFLIRYQNSELSLHLSEGSPFSFIAIVGRY